MLFEYKLLNEPSCVLYYIKSKFRHEGSVFAWNDAAALSDWIQLKEGIMFFSQLYNIYIEIDPTNVGP
jgi:hypothetical protein